MTIWMIRHAQSQSNAGQATISPDDNGLSELGFQQAQCVAKAIASSCPQGVATYPDWVATSPYWRTQLTAQPLLEKFPQLKSEIWQVQEFTYLSLDPRQPTTYWQRKPLSEAYWERCDPDYVDGERAESFQQLIARSQHILDCIRQHQGFGVVFSHSLFIKTLLWMAIAQPSRIDQRAMQRFCGFWRSFQVPNASILKIEVTADQQISWSSFQTDHLPRHLNLQMSPEAVSSEAADQPS